MPPLDVPVTLVSEPLFEEELLLEEELPLEDEPPPELLFDEPDEFELPAAASWAKMILSAAPEMLDGGVTDGRDPTRPAPLNPKNEVVRPAPVLGGAEDWPEPPLCPPPCPLPDPEP